MSHNREGHSCSAKGSSSLRQTLDEMDFERGIWYAAQQNDLDRVEYLLRRNKSVNEEDLAGYTALHYAARNGHISVCEKLLEYGASVNSRTRSGQATALHRAASQGHARIIELLLRANADPDIKDADGFTALHRAIKSEAFDVCRILITTSNLRIIDDRGRTYSAFAIDIGNEEIIDLIKDYELK